MLTAMRSAKTCEDVPRVPRSSLLLETFAVQFVVSTLALAHVLAAFLPTTPEADPVFGCAAFLLGPAALLAILIEVDYHRRSPPRFSGSQSAFQLCLV